MAFVKIHSMILTSSINDSAVHVRWLWIVCLASADRHGRFRATPAALARMANLPLKQIREGLDVLTSPDPSSSTEDEDGRRLIEESPNEWRIVNYPKYRAMKDPNEERAKTAERVRKHREAKRNVTPVTKCNANAEADAEADAVVAKATGEAKPRKRSEGQQALDHYAAEYERLFGTPAVVEWGKDVRTMARLVKSVGLSVAKKIITFHLEAPDPWVKENNMFEPEHVVAQANKTSRRMTAPKVDSLGYGPESRDWRNSRMEG